MGGGIRRGALGAAGGASGPGESGGGEAVRLARRHSKSTPESEERPAQRARKARANLRARSVHGGFQHPQQTLKVGLADHDRSRVVELALEHGPRPDAEDLDRPRTDVEFRVPDLAHRLEEEERSEEHTSELQSLRHLVCRLLLEKKKTNYVVRAAMS